LFHFSLHFHQFTRKSILENTTNLVKLVARRRQRQRCATTSSTQSFLITAQSKRDECECVDVC